MEWAPDGSQLVRGGQDGEIKWWSPTGECLNTLKGHSNSVTNVEFEQDGATLVSSDGAETIRWDVATGARKDKVDRQFAFTKATNGRYIVTDDHPFIVLTETKFSFLCIPVWICTLSTHTHTGLRLKKKHM